MASCPQKYENIEKIKLIFDEFKNRKFKIQNDLDFQSISNEKYDEMTQRAFNFLKERLGIDYLNSSLDKLEVDEQIRVINTSYKRITEI